MANNRVSLFSVPKLLQMALIVPRLTNESIVHLIMASVKNKDSGSLVLAKNPKTQAEIITLYIEELFKRLCQHVVLGQQNEVNAIIIPISQFPKLLLYALTSRRIVRDHFGRKIEGTPLQIAWCCQDFAITKENQKKYPEMADMLLYCLLKLDNGKQLAWEQFQQQFPHDEYENMEVSKEFKQLVKGVIAEIDNWQTFTYVFKAVEDPITGKTIKNVIVNDATEEALKKLRGYLAPKEKPIAQGLCFNMYYFSYILMQFEKIYKGWNKEQKAAFKCKVFDLFDCSFTASTRMLMSNDVYEYAVKKKPLVRMLIKNSIYRFPLPFNVQVENGGKWAGRCATIKNLCQAKIETVKNLKAKLDPLNQLVSQKKVKPR